MWLNIPQSRFQTLLSGITLKYFFPLFSLSILSSLCANIWVTCLEGEVSVSHIYIPPTWVFWRFFFQSPYKKSPSPSRNNINIPYWTLPKHFFSPTARKGRHLVPMETRKKNPYPLCFDLKVGKTLLSSPQHFGAHCIKSKEVIPPSMGQGTPQWQVTNNQTSLALCTFKFSAVVTLSLHWTCKLSAALIVCSSWMGSKGLNKLGN